jgi:hypothetical protein
VPEIAAIHHDSEGKKEAGYAETEYRGTAAFQEDGRMRVRIVRTEAYIYVPTSKHLGEEPVKQKVSRKDPRTEKGH